MINNIDARHAACLVYALEARNDRQLQSDISYVASELELDDELDVYAALDDLMGAMYELEAAL